MKQLLYIFCTVFLLSACAVEQTNVFIQSPCKSVLQDNVIRLGLDSTALVSGENYVCRKKDGYYEIYMLDQNADWDREIFIEINETTLPTTRKVYEIYSPVGANPGDVIVRAPGKATIKISLDNIEDGYAYEGELYVSYEDGHWVIDMCAVELLTEYDSYGLSGRVLGKW